MSESLEKYKIKLNKPLICSVLFRSSIHSFENPQHTFWLKNKNNNSSYAILSGGLVLTNSKLEQK